MKAIALAAGFALAILAGPAAGQAPADRDCSDDNSVDRCAADQQRRVRELFGVRSIEEHRDAGDQVRRIFYVDGYGRDIVLISFIRSAGREPTAYVHVPRREGQPLRAPLEAPVPRAAWEDVLRRSELFDRSFAQPAPPPPARGEEQMFTICLHGWVYTIEANDPRRRGDPASLRRKTEGACEDGPGEAFANELQRAALPLFPICDALHPGLHRNAASQLAACTMLSGDRLAAAAVLNLVESFRFADRRDTGDQLAGLFDPEGVRIDWQGTQYSRPAQPQDFWVARMAADGAQGLYYESVEGLSADRVRFRGFLHRSVDRPNVDDPVYSLAPVEMIWVYTQGREYKVESITVGAWVVQRED